jgi:hypothetical protein
MTDRRSFLTGAALIGAGMVSKAGAASLPEAPLQSAASTAAPCCRRTAVPTTRSSP